jgi:hypothetical protein
MWLSNPLRILIQSVSVHHISVPVRISCTVAEVTPMRRVRPMVYIKVEFILRERKLPAGPFQPPTFITQPALVAAADHIDRSAPDR